MNFMTRCLLFFFPQMDDDTNQFVESFEHMLTVWVSILHESQSFPPEFCRESAIEIFNTYVQCHLSPPDGIRGVGAGSNGASDDDEEIDDTEESDRQR